MSGSREAGQPIVRAAPGPCGLTQPIYVPCVVTISITIAAFEAIKSTLSDADAFPPQLDEHGGIRFVVDHKTLDRLIALRGTGESYSDVILRLASENVAKGLADSLDLSRIYESAFLQLVANHVSPISEINPRRESAA